MRKLGVSLIEKHVFTPFGINFSRSMTGTVAVIVIVTVIVTVIAANGFVIMVFLSFVSMSMI